MCPMETCTHLYHLPGFHEPFNAISHLASAVLFVGLGVKLLRKGAQEMGQESRQVSYTRQGYKYSEAREYSHNEKTLMT